MLWKVSSSFSAFSASSSSLSSFSPYRLRGVVSRCMGWSRKLLRRIHRSTGWPQNPYCQLWLRWFIKLSCAVYQSLRHHRFRKNNQSQIPQVDLEILDHQTCEFLLLTFSITRYAYMLLQKGQPNVMLWDQITPGSVSKCNFEELQCSVAGRCNWSWIKNVSL